MKDKNSILIFNINFNKRLNKEEITEIKENIQNAMMEVLNSYDMYLCDETLEYEFIDSDIIED